MDEPSSSWPENLPSHRKRAIEELIRGRDLTSQLHMMLRNPGKVFESSVSVDDLMKQIMATFTETLSVLNLSSSSYHHEVSQIPTSRDIGGKSEDSGESSKTSTSKDGRGCYKRRKTWETYERVSSTLIDDGHAWRKYGQKEILNSKHPRNYYRCTHKYEQGCQATKQVQRTEDDPPMYRTTYHGHHTCTNLPKPPQFIFDSTPTATAATATDHSLLLSFDSKCVLEKNHGSHFPTLKHYDKYMADLQSMKRGRDFLKSTSHHQLDSSGHPTCTMLSSGVISSKCTTSSYSLGMDMMVGGMKFDDFPLEFYS